MVFFARHTATPKSRARAQQPVRSRVSSRGRWRTCQGRFKMQTLTYCNAKITSTRTAVGQFKGQFNGAMERYTWVRFAGKLTSCHRHTWSRSAHQRGDGTLHVCDGGKATEGSKCKHSHPATQIMSTHVQPPVSSKFSSRGRWRKCGRRFKMRALTSCNAKVTSTRATTGQFKGQFKGAME